MNLRFLEVAVLHLIDLFPKRIGARIIPITIACLPLIAIKLLRKTVFHRPSLSSDTENETPDLPGDIADEDICIRYSGGVDSTLAAHTLGKHFRKVHLLTFDTSYDLPLIRLFASNPGNASINLEHLRRIDGTEKYTHSILPIHRLRDRIYFDDYCPASPGMNYLRANLCPACTMVMHIETIAYCLKHGIRYVSDGANVSTGVFTWQTQNRINLEAFQRFYSEYGINYLINPNYELEDPDAALIRERIADDHVDSGNYRYRRKTQQFCIPIHLQSLCRRLHGSDVDSQSQTDLIRKYFVNHIPEYDSYIRKKAGS